MLCHKTLYIGDLEVDVTFGVEVEQEWLEPYSWGQSRGYIWTISEVEIDRLEFFDEDANEFVTLNEKQAIERFGADAVNALREQVSDDDLDF